MQNWILKMYLENESQSIDTWDIQWSYHFHCENGLTITPINNLIQNIGIHGSHFSHRTPFHNMQTKTICLDNLYMSRINPPLSIQHEIDTIAFENILKRKLPLIRRVSTKIKRIFKI